MDKNALNALSDLTVFNKYAKFIPELGRRETWDEIVMRNMRMHQSRYPALESEIGKVYQDYVFTKRVLPSMRSKRRRPAAESPQRRTFRSPATAGSANRLEAPREREQGCGGGVG